MFFFSSLFLFCLFFYMATVKNCIILSTLPVAGISPFCIFVNYPFTLSIHKAQTLFCSRPKRLDADAHPACVSISSADKVLCFTTGYLDLLRLHLHHPHHIFPCLLPPNPLGNPTANHALGCARSQVCA